MIDLHCDFEFNRPADPDMGLISCCLWDGDKFDERYWLRDDADKKRLIRDLLRMKSTHTIIAYAVELAEGRCFAALGLNPSDFKWRDLYLEWRWLRNEDDRFRYGKVIKGEGANMRPIYTVPPRHRAGKKASREEKAEADAKNLIDLEASALDYEEGTELGNDESNFSLLDCAYFFEVVDFDACVEDWKVKVEVRDRIIIGGTPETIELNKQRILDYNRQDLQWMVDLSQVITQKMTEVGEESHLMVFQGQLYPDYTLQDVGALQTRMGAWAARLAKYAMRGLPLDKGRMATMIKVLPELKLNAMDSWQREHPDAPLYRKGFSRSMAEKRKGCALESAYKSEAQWTEDQDSIDAWLTEYVTKLGLNWPRGDSGRLSRDKKVISRFSGNALIKDYERQVNMLSAYKTFSPNKQGRIEALDHIGKDGRQRPMYGPMGTQTGRNAAKAKSFILAQSHWMRAMINPPKGRAIVELDYGSQEVFIGAVLSGDENLLATYLANDTYVKYAQLIGMYPADLDIPTEEQRSQEWFKPYKLMRDMAKTMFLSLQFGCGYKALTAAVRDAKKDPTISEEQGKEWVNAFNEAYAELKQMQAVVLEYYKSGMAVMLPSGWRLGPSNPWPLSVGNLPIQGHGSVILQRACELADDKGVIIIATLHDAMTAECDEADIEWCEATLRQCMLDAAEEILGVKGMKVGEPEIVRHGDWWVHGKGTKVWQNIWKYWEQHGAVKEPHLRGVRLDA